MHDAVLRHCRAIVGGGLAMAAGAAWIAPDGTEGAILWGRVHPEDATGPIDPGLRLRAASITKGALGRLVAVLGLNLGAPHVLPHGPPVTLGGLLSHTDGIRDFAGYLPGPSETPRTLAPRAREAPGPFFYSNLSALVAAQIVEEEAGERIDTLLARHVLRPAGIDGGLNWAGVRDRTRRLPLHQRRGDRLVPSVDGAQWPWDAPALAGGAAIDLGACLPGRDTALLSPHAGLRASLPELARLARLFGADDAAGRLQRKVRWRHDGTNGEAAGGLFPAQALSLTPHDALPGRPVGHAGHALGFSGGAWHGRATGLSFAYGLTGVADATEGLRTEVFLPEEELGFLRLFAEAGPP
ncbi:CubicO group peptidase (beta-lactamase class C family) [Hasllibacter halocynthiae]|uniref:CubicO group peptidase (Beta-lactamase class C family) n=1 Tax=Hasllibacter halocynthiae TaxID=595589 RepID=A0A2T0X2A6_9RHOB|nr:serine hydrolase domain-containing protein [Hasllibacter halocynthiae]PRY93071.1 CubicO group peptidase (beta-lactamase class C family) [Hasllibacter halocynthiae]